jgi:hypothetical protein
MKKEDELEKENFLIQEDCSDKMEQLEMEKIQLKMLLDETIELHRKGIYLSIYLFICINIINYYLFIYLSIYLPI